MENQLKFPKSSPLPLRKRGNPFGTWQSGNIVSILELLLLFIATVIIIIIMLVCLCSLLPLWNYTIIL